MEETMSKQKISLAKWLLITILLSTITCLSQAVAAPSPDLWPHWQTHVADDTTVIDHSPWDTLLKKYLVINHPSGINRFRYEKISQEDKKALNAYLEHLQQIKVSALNRKEQKAYWINLYNGLTVKVILDHYPVKSIMDIDISPGFFSNGPWDAKLLTIEGKKVSLNDIEHRILRPIFKDNRLHYALNCASLGCPNLQPMAFTSAKTEEMLEAAAKEYINSNRGAQMLKNRLQVSSIYKWFRVDFGGSESGVINHLRQYAKGDLADALRTYNRRLRDDYDWNLNGP